MNAGDVALEAMGVEKALAGRSVLRGVDLRLRRGEIVALRGANGSGKTTLLRCLAGRLRPDSGEIRWGGRVAGPDRQARRLIGMLGHETALYPHLTLRENLCFAARMGEVAQPARRADRWLAHAGLAAEADCLPGHVSRGMRQRVALARACLHDPGILLLDEPFSGLDAEGTEWVADLLATWAGRGRAICLVTHEAPLARRLAGAVLELRSGRVHTVAAGHLEAAEPPTTARAA